MQEEEEDVRVEMSFLEIYIENVYDLLAAADAVRVLCVLLGFGPA